MTTRIEIDPNVRVRGGTYVGFEDVHGAQPSPGDCVEVFEGESGLIGLGTVTALDSDRSLIYIDVDWSQLSVPSGFTVRADSAGFSSRSGWFEVIGLVSGPTTLLDHPVEIPIGFEVAVRTSTTSTAVSAVSVHAG